MAAKTKKARTPITASVRQSVTIPGRLAVEVRRVAKEKHLTMSRALVTLAEQGVEAEASARSRLKTSYERFMSETDTTKKDAAGRDLIRSIFGDDAIAKNPLR